MSARIAHIARAMWGPALAALLIAGGGSALTALLTESTGAGEIAVAWPLDPSDRGAVSSLTIATGDLGILGLGSLVVILLAALLAWRSRLVLSLAAGCLTFLMAALILRYEAAPHDLGRFDGHARNFALAALMLALSQRLYYARPRWRYAAAALIAGLVVWPTIAAPARKVALALGHGVQVSNPQPGLRAFGDRYWWMGRYALERFPSDQIAAWLRDHAEVDARVLSPLPHAMTVTTGRPNASGFRQFLHPRPTTGPEYLDAIRHLEPAAIRRLGFTFVHAPDDWVAELPERAKAWLSNPRLFELLVRDGSQTLYRVRQGFVQLEVPPSPGAYEALRQAVPARSAVVSVACQWLS